MFLFIKIANKIIPTLHTKNNKLHSENTHKMWWSKFKPIHCFTRLNEWKASEAESSQLSYWFEETAKYNSNKTLFIWFEWNALQVSNPLECFYIIVRRTS